MRIIGARYIAALTASASAALAMVAAAEADDVTSALGDMLMDRLVTRLGIASAIEAACPGHALTPAMEQGIDILKSSSTSRTALIERIVVATAAAGRAYELPRGATVFCNKALAEHGPDSDDPLVVGR